jgi:hypothetical protein
MPLTDTEREKCRYALGYPAVSALASVQFGIPRPLATSYLLETAMNQLMEIAVPRVQRILGELDACEAAMSEARSYLIAEKLEELSLREDATQRLEEEYRRWASRLADVFGVPFYGFSNKLRGGSGDSRGSGVSMIKRN